MRIPLDSLTIRAAAIAIHELAVRAAQQEVATDVAAATPEGATPEAVAEPGIASLPLFSQWCASTKPDLVGLRVRAGSRKGAKADQRRARKSRNKRKSR